MGVSSPSQRSSPGPTELERWRTYSLSRFFFSSRRRHTRFSRDWSSDVCSSDLHRPRNGSVLRDESRGALRTDSLHAPKLVVSAVVADEREPLADARGRHLKALLHDFCRVANVLVRRSEERRVGKECRSRWATEH